jgi:ferredoxin
MKGLICYYSGSGNTKLACQYVAKKVASGEFDLFDIVEEKGNPPDLSHYAIAGFATFADFVGPPRLFLDFVAGLPRQTGKPAFVLATYGSIYGRMLKALERAVTGRGFTVIAGHMLHTPESYPPMIAGGRGYEHAPDERELSEFDDFVAELSHILDGIKEGKTPKRKRLRVGFPNSLIPPTPRTVSRWMMGNKFVAEELCIECGICQKRCPYGAIELAPKPVFDMSKCYGCWACYNHCPKQAIYTRKFRGVGHYPKPNDQLKEKLAV